MKIIKLGEVRSEYKNRMVPYDYEHFMGMKSRIIINRKYQEALNGLKKGDLIDVVFFMDKVKRSEVRLTAVPKGDSKNKRTGLFNTRSPFRFNPIGISTVRIVDIRKNEIEVLGLDAFDESPLIDIKRHVRGMNHEGGMGDV